MGKRRRGGAVGEFPAEALETRHPIREGRMYRVSPLGGGQFMFDPKVPGWEPLRGTGADIRIEPGDTFLAVERASGAGKITTDELWLVLCKGVLCKVLLSEWALREVMEVPE